MAAQTQDAIFSCSGTVKACTAPFASAFSFKIVETVEDGDCFFDSLLQSGEIEEPASTLSAQAQQRLRLRKRLVDYLENPDILASLSEFGFNDIEQNIQQLRKAKVYACDAGDLPTQFAHEAFGINLHVYVINYHKRTKRTVVTLERHYNMDPSAPTIHVLRIGEHFKLLRPLVSANQLENHIQHGIETERPYYEERRMVDRNMAVKASKKASKKNSHAANANNKKYTLKKNTSSNNLQKAIDASLENDKLVKQMTNLNLTNNKRHNAQHLTKKINQKNKNQRNIKLNAKKLTSLKGAYTRAIKKLQEKNNPAFTPLEQEALNYFS